MAEKYAVDSLAVFGSVARGEADIARDGDLLVQPPVLLDCFRLAWRLSEVIASPVDLVMETSLRPALRERILAEAITDVTPDRDPVICLDDILDAATRAMHFVADSSFEECEDDDCTTDAVFASAWRSSAKPRNGCPSPCEIAHRTFPGRHGRDARQADTRLSLDRPSSRLANRSQVRQPNNRPRPTLGWMKPSEVFSRFAASTS